MEQLTNFLSFKNFKQLTFIFIFLFGTSYVFAHQSGCKHHHDGSWDTSIDCDNPGAACTHDGVTGTCKTKIAWNYRDCVCTAVKKKKIYEIGNLAAVIDNIPVENGFTTMSFMPEDATVYSVWDGVNESADMNGEFIAGYIKMKFGTFEDLTRIPVQILDVNFSVSEYVFNGSASGNNNYSLNQNAKNQFFYNAKLNYLFVDTYEENLQLVLKNEIVGETNVVFALEGFFDLDTKSVKLRTQANYDSVILNANISSGSSIGMFIMMALMALLFFGFYSRKNMPAR